VIPAHASTFENKPFVGKTETGYCCYFIYFTLTKSITECSDSILSNALYYAQATSQCYPLLEFKSLTNEIKTHLQDAN